MATKTAVRKTAVRPDVLDAFRRWGFLEANLDPLGFFPSASLRAGKPLRHPELEIEGEDAELGRRHYCGTIGAEFMHIPQPERRTWIQQRMEAEPPKLSAAVREQILERLIRAELFEQILQARYLGTKRYSLEGTAALIPLMDEILEALAEQGGEEAVVAMSHRGRLNVIVQIVRRQAAEVFAGFEDLDPRSVMGGGDVKYHLGATGRYRTRAGAEVRIHLVSNPSHLDAVDPVAMGRVRAKHTRMGPEGPKRIVPVVLHGDAAFAGQGILAETLNMAELEGYRVGGSVHIIVNNLIGFTTRPEEAHSSRFASDLARRLPIPIFHVNAEDPEAVVRAGRMALEYRYAFGSEVVVDLIGYRRHGHSEVDDPTITQPQLYQRIEKHPAVWESYAAAIKLDAEPILKRVRAEYEAAQQEGEQLQKKPVLRTLPAYWDAFTGGNYKPEYEVDTGLTAEEIAGLGEALTRVPESFHIHAKVKKLLEQRLEMARGKRPVDFGMAEALAFASLVKQGVPVRLSGQDSRRGTFNQRHAAWVDTETEEIYFPLAHIAPQQAWIEIHNSPLSEAAVLGYEYGFSRDYPEALVLWEAQFGDFANNAQGIIDQFICAGEDKWGLLSGVVLLLPHGYEGQGPEHSSARIERYLQLAAEENILVCQPSTAAQYFHLLRRHALRKWRKPLVVFTPKSMLRRPDAASKIESFTRQRFYNVIPEMDEGIERVERVILCSGKIGHELRRERRKRKEFSTAIIFLEQLYPFPDAELAAVLDLYNSAREIVWVQEEPANKGALFYVLPHLRRQARGRPIRSVKRAASASPATGSGKAHELEQKTLLTLAFATAKAAKD